MTDSTHTCAVCDRRIPPRLLMCWPHWQQVPKDTQRAVVKAWGDLNWGSTRQTPAALASYAKARQAAIDAVRPATTTTGEPT